MITRNQSRLWNEYIHRYHYLGHKPLPGAQLRYLVTLDEKIIAALGFSAAAWQTAPCDHKLAGARTAAKKLVVSREQCSFSDYALDEVQKPRFYVLSMITHHLPIQWEERYRIRPMLLETLVDTERGVFQDSFRPHSLV
ncbi:hypothetical protein bplSymb_SCF05801P001 [Bathymodiolus platifrons methanotrophic gill symbiont]|uniref:Druantia anti-phage system protein DruA n=1 Tax=Bathymodiolus platifrons methanotrophic gill symbiont TaxID=113268 RepID=UPI000B6FE804|nr:Druantia anti-phage system protein DruA [Bathymodiolus platifrons methanotrophic gill symbiont]TXK96228.1 hypothetical protein BMR10_08310 [Methylococcaceae bacterium CS4]TXL01264.1 hypothetical protein BMR11_00105 [Methylococcaceae bacterium CS5]TXL08897.1 hypothetical protein BMR07_00735 [Methylococcaceae bacterium CS1]TXL09280.1 hypothetical protein BMR09_01720 [Methylococcaceae bacterium CS3]TXL11927.1 hypothetical protein BMR08_02265 [Methylococcaceae bacterium CS2]